MADMTVSGPRALGAAFAKNATPPAEDLKKANRFLETLQELQSTGTKPTADHVSEGAKLLHDLQAKAEDFLFRAAVGAGIHATSENDIERQIQQISKEAETLQLTTDRLRKTLRQLAG